MAGKGKAKPEARKGRLKVFRTAVGFHDAYVAAPSRKAALEAWGTDKDLFARGVAEEVIEPSLMAEPLAAPGTVFRQFRSAPADLAAEPRKLRKAKVEETAPPKARMRPVPPPPPPPRPSEGEVRAARRALDGKREQHEVEQRNLAARERELASERRAMESRQSDELRRLFDRLEAAQRTYDDQLRAWERATSEGRRN